MMKTESKHFQVNPIGRDLIIMIATGMFGAIALVTVVLILINQL